MMSRMLFVPLLVPLMIAGASAASITVSPPAVTVGDQMTISVHGGSNVRDWVDLVPPAAIEGAYSPNWQYLSGTKTVPEVPVTDTDMRVLVPATIPGNYEVRLYLAGSRVIAARAPLAIKAKPLPTGTGVSSVKCTGSVTCAQSTGDVTITGLAQPGPAGPPGPSGSTGQPGPALCDLKAMPKPAQLGDSCWGYKFDSDGAAWVYHGYGMPTSPTNKTLIWMYYPQFSVHATPP